jgi:peptidoglycan-associated lipoprotein
MILTRSWFGVGLIALIICFNVTFTGCAKKVGIKSDAPTTQEQKAVAKESAVGAASASASEDQAARERAFREQELREQAARDAAAKAAREQSEKDAAAKAAREAAEKSRQAAASAILKELQIPDINFDYNKYDLTPAAQAILKAGASSYLKYKEYKLVVEGHCDERGTVEYNLALGQKRADEAAKYLTDLGIEKARIKTISYGKEMPLVKESSETAWAKNRRAHFVVLPPVK